MEEIGICLQCKKSFTLNRKDKKYCRRGCKQVASGRRSGRTNRKAKLKAKPYIIYKGDTCEFCNFLPIHPCQLDVDHKDGNHSNNDPNNLQTLCANCHRLKTFLHRDWEKS